MKTGAHIRLTSQRLNWSKTSVKVASLIRRAARPFTRSQNRASPHGPSFSISSTLMPFKVRWSLSEILNRADFRPTTKTRNLHFEMHNSAIYANLGFRSVKRGCG